MGKIAEAFERQRKLYERDRLYVLPQVEINGELHDVHTTDESVTNVLMFKGSGEPKRFKEILKEFVEYSDWWMETLWETGNRPTKHDVWLDTWVIQKNYRVIYESGDIIINPTAKVGNRA